MIKWYYIYVLISKKDKKLYTGYTSNLENRIKMHQSGKVPATKTRLPIRLIYSEACLNKDDAIAREKHLKSGMGKRYLENRLEAYLQDL